MTYDRSRRDDERRKAEDKKRQDYLRKKAAEQKAIDDRRRADAAKAKQAQKKKQTSKPIDPKPVTVTPQDVTPIIPAQSNVTPQRLKKTDAMKEEALREQAIANQARDDRRQALFQPEPAKPFWETLFTPDPPKYKGFFDKVGELGGKAWNKVTSFGTGFGGQFLDNQATTAAQDAINPPAGEARKDWLQRQGAQDPAFKAGQTTADIVNIGQGVIQMKQGADSIGGGIGATASGQLHIAVPAIAGGAINVGTGAVTSHRALTHLMHGSSGRLSNSGKARSNHEEAGGHLNEGDQAHHHNTDNQVRNHPLNKVAREKTGYDLDRATNIEAFPSADKVYPEGPQVLHRGSHPNWDKHAANVLDRFETALEKKYGSLDKVPKDVLEKTMESVETRLKNDIPDLQKGLGEGWLKPTPHGNYKLSENTTEQERTT
jgi:hypothetical protein